MTYSRANKSWYEAEKRKFFTLWRSKYHYFMRVGRHQFDWPRQ